MARCDIHEIDNCADCTGATARHRDSLKDAPAWQVQQERGTIPFISGGTTIRARFPGSCAGCGARFEANDVIFSPQMESGWYAECCYGHRLGS